MAVVAAGDTRSCEPGPRREQQEPVAPCSPPLSRLEDEEGTPRLTLAACNSGHYTAPVNVYFVRHAESQDNALRKHQVASVGLSELGIKQAKRVTQRLVTKNIDAVISSPYERARQTAEFISAAVQKPIELTPLLTELKRPTAIEGRHYDDPEAVRIRSAIIANLHDPAWRYADEETFFDARERAIQCITFITQLDKSNVLLITHGGIIGMIIAVMLHGKEMGVGDFLKLRTFMRADNAGITLCKYMNDKTWKLITWNDCAHLECLADLSSSRSDWV
jgi:broad specificity phosphatase PhoE